MKGSLQTSMYHKNLQRDIFSSYNYMPKPGYKGKTGNAPKFKILQQISSNELTTAYHSTLLWRCTSKKVLLFGGETWTQNFGGIYPLL